MQIDLDELLAMLEKRQAARQAKGLPIEVVTLPKLIAFLNELKPKYMKTTLDLGSYDLKTMLSKPV